MAVKGGAGNAAGLWPRSKDASDGSQTSMEDMNRSAMMLMPRNM